MVFLDRVPPPRGVGSEWLAKVRADARMAAETKALLVAGELARHIGHDGSGELPSAVDLARAVKLTEDVAIDSVNQLIFRGYVALLWRPRISFATQFFVRPSGYQAAMIAKTASKGSPGAGGQTRSK